MMPHHSLTRPESKNGFALVVSLSLMAFILLLLLSITALVRVENQSATIQQQQNEAQQNALLGLQMALGELQRTAGPDQRVTATADILDDTNIGKRNTVGVWASADSSPNDSSTFDKGDLLRWLTSDAVDTNQAANETYNEDPVTGNTITLVGAESLPSTNGVLDNPDDAIVIDITNTTISKDNSTVGRYGWWVGDEGVKARVNLSRPQTGSTDAEAIKQRGVLNVGSNSINNPVALPNLNAIDFANDAESLQQLKDLELIPGGSADIAEDYFHDLTTYSSGVLADIKNGGLKKDLSLAFEMDDTDFLQSEFSIEPDDSSYPQLDVTGFGVARPVFWLDNSTGVPAHGPVWNLLRDYYRIYHSMQTPMSNPTFEAQIFGPNLHHDRYELNAGDDIRDQPAIQMAGGKLMARDHEQERGPLKSIKDTIGSGLWAGNAEPRDNILRYRLLSDAEAQQEASGDPLRWANSGPIMTTANYLPYLLRMIADTGIYLTGSVEQHNGKDYQKAQFKVREAFILHNPYNVNVSHKDIYIDAAGWETRFDVLDPAGANYRESWNGKTGGQAKTGEVKNVGQNIRYWKTELEAGTFTPGQIISIPGSYRERGYASIGADPNWHHPYSGASGGTSGSNITNYIEVGDAQFIPRGQKDGEFLDLSKNGQARIFSALHMGQDKINTTAVPGNKYFIANSWPAASVIDTSFVIPGREYPGTAADEVYLPMDDTAFTDGGGSQARYAYPSEIITIGGSSPYNETNPLPLIRYDLTLKPSIYAPNSENNIRYPAFVLTNPTAPVKDSKNLLPIGDVKDDPNRRGYPHLSPDYAFSIDEPTGGAGVNYAYWGHSSGSPGEGSPHVTLLELPTTPLLSLGKLQHANVTVHGHMPALAISNSFASPFISKANTYEVYENRYGQDRIFYDVSYLMNDALWDSYFFSSYSIPYNSNADDYDVDSRTVKESFDAAFVANNQPLPNSNMKLLLATGEDTTIVSNKLFESGNPSADSYKRAAENLVLEGAFNINSTSESAWKTVLSGARGVNIYRNSSATDVEINLDTTPFSRTSQPTEAATGGDIDANESWNGYRSLTDDEIDVLATAIVTEIKQRVNDQGHPILTLSSFVNRRLVDNNFGKSGIIQTAIDTTDINSDYSDDSGAEITAASLSDNGKMPHADNLLPTGENARSANASAPTFVLQGDVLQAIGAQISARSDTFRIRSYGESLDPITGAPNGKAWCEAIVQRTPTPVKGQNVDPATNPDYWSAKDSNGTPYPLGRQFVILSFRWLSEDEV